MNIVKALSIRIPCTVCGEFYEVPLTDILLSYRMLEQGCPVPDETECPPLFQTRLIPRDVLHDFVEAWQRLEKSVDRDNGELMLSDCIKKMVGVAELLHRAQHHVVVSRSAVVDQGS